jgi:fimbrial chaperone protein
MFKIFLVFLLSQIGLNCQAGAFSVTPVRLFFEPRDRAVAVTLANEGDTEIALQADVLQWQQDAAGLDQLTLSDDLIVSPPSLKLAPRSRQVIRLALLVPRDPSRQMTYRLLVREIPPTPTNTRQGVQLPIALVLNMPVFVTPPVAKRKLECDIGPVPTVPLEVRCQNTGSAYSQLNSLELSRSGQRLAGFEGSTYLLPGARKTIAIKSADNLLAAPGPAELVLRFDDLQTQRLTVHVP